MDDPFGRAKAERDNRVDESLLLNPAHMDKGPGMRARMKPCSGARAKTAKKGLRDHTAACQQHSLKSSEMEQETCANHVRSRYRSGTHQGALSCSNLNLCRRLNTCRSMRVALRIQFPIAMAHKTRTHLDHELVPLVSRSLDVDDRLRREQVIWHVENLSAKRRQRRVEDSPRLAIAACTDRQPGDKQKTELAYTNTPARPSV